MAKNKIVTRSVSALMLISILSVPTLEAVMMNTHASAESTSGVAQQTSDVNGNVGNTEVDFNSTTGVLTIGNTTTNNQTFDGQALRNYIDTNIPNNRTSVKTINFILLLLLP